MKIQLLGIGALRLETGNGDIYLDACNGFTEVPVLGENDILLFTHNDHDHFSAEKTGEALLESTRIIGPPTIVYPLWKENIIDPERLTVLYPSEYDKPEKITLNGITITAFNTDHFVNWHNVHISFMIEYGGKRVYISGDSFLRKENLDVISGVDLFVHSLLKEEIVKGQMDKRFSAFYHICEINDLMRSVEPSVLMINHLIGCDWAMNPEELKSFLLENPVGNVIVPVSEDEIFEV